ncbi:MAG: tRNA pseudouridine(55) synthase TruB [Caldanaerobacter sp.]|uniref:tRNA pseudouridine(55) synthase TruB n=1 Tax=Caldanaerobacter sp. TaxID=2930036 RepID=UPI003C747067
MSIDGVLNVLKPPGMTSHDIVDFVRRIYNTKKVGHTGTLDPDAVGVLPLCIGRATKFSSYLMEHHKRYRFEITFGISTDTLDKSGKIIETGPTPSFSLDELRKVINKFKGEIQQIPPIYSAKKVRGKKLYEYARRGEVIEIPPIKVTIYELDIVEYRKPNHLLLDVKCSKGTYVRALVRDICKELGVLGYMSFLIRTESGDFTLDNSYTIEEIEEGKASILPVDTFLKLPSVVLDRHSSSRILRGQPVENIYNIENSQVKLYDGHRNFIGIGVAEKKRIRVKRLF